MHCVIYRDGGGEPVEGSLEEMLRALTGLGDGEFGWLSLTRPEQETLGQVESALHLPPLAVEDALHAHQRAKVERYSEQLFVVLKTLTYADENSSIETGEVEMFVLENAVVTVSHGKVDDPVPEAKRRLEAEPQLLKFGPGAAIYTLADTVVDAYTRIVEEIRTDLTQLEMAVFAAEREDLTERIYGLKREVLEFREAIEPLEPVGQDILHGRSSMPGGETPRFRDVADHVMRVHGAVRGFDELLNSILSAHLARVGMWQNEDMRKISAYAALIAVPTLIAGVYGMNFKHMPELNWLYGYPLAVLAMLVGVFVLFRVFRRSGWL